MTNTIKKSLLLAGSVLAFGAAVPTADAQAQSGQSVTSAARQDCKNERRFDRFEFRQDYRGTGKAALRRCIVEQKREARFDCREDRLDPEDSAEYRAQYGTGKASIKRCMIDELR